AAVGGQQRRHPPPPRRLVLRHDAGLAGGARRGQLHADGQVGGQVEAHPLEHRQEQRRQGVHAGQVGWLVFARAALPQELVVAREALSQQRQAGAHRLDERGRRGGGEGGFVEQAVDGVGGHVTAYPKSGPRLRRGSSCGPRLRRGGGPPLRGGREKKTNRD